LEAPRWTNARVHQPFQTWLALSWQARPRAFRAAGQAAPKTSWRKLSEERATLEDVLKEVGHPYHEAVWMLRLVISQIELELKWLESNRARDIEARAREKEEAVNLVRSKLNIRRPNLFFVQNVVICFLAVVIRKII
jgi:hypothetical protein